MYIDINQYRLIKNIEGEKKMKRITALLLSLIMVLSLCACGGKKKDVAHDPDGFLGYSDSFWEWYEKNN